MADHTKIGTAAFMTYCDLREIDCFVTDNLPPLKYVDFFKRNDIELLYAESK